MKTISQFFIKTNTYTSLFETQFMNKMQDFYSQQSDEKIDDLGVTDYFNFAMATIQVESQFSYYYLESESFLKVTECLEDVLFKQHISEIMGDLPKLINNFPKSQVTLKTLLEVIQNCELVGELVKAWSKYIVDSGCQSLDKIGKLKDMKPLEDIK